jgi:CubicO group peptidase (beta-lactamase class C family)
MTDVVLPDSPAGQRLDALLDAMRRGAVDEPTVREHVAESFLAQVPPSQLIAISGQLRDQLEHLALDWVDPAASPTSLSVELVAAGGQGVQIDVAVESPPPHRITGLGFRPLDANRPTLGPVDGLPARDVRSRVEEGTLDDEVAAALHAAVEELVADGGQVGVVAAVVVGDAVWTADAGLASVEAAVRTSADTVFRAYSVSKTFTTATLLSLVEDGVLDLDDPVDKHLTAYRLVPPDGGPQPTIRQVLTHTAGVSSAFEHWVEHVVPVAEQLGAEWPCDTAPGTAWAYSNGGFATLGQLVEDVTGEPFEDVAAARVLRPLGMDDSEFRRTNALGERWAVGYSVRRGEVAAADTTVPSVLAAGSLFSTGRDLARWVRHAATEQDRFGWFEPQVDAAVMGARGDGVGQGLGWMLADVDERRWAMHGGGGHGFSTFVSVLPGTGAGLVLLTNVGGQTLGPAVQRVQRILQAHVG